MIVVRVELWSAVTGHKTELARMVVDNIGVSSNMQKGDYRIRTLRGRSEDALTKAMHTALRGKGGVQREGKVLNHARLQLHVWNLIAKALSGLGYGKE